MENRKKVEEIIERETFFLFVLQNSLKNKPSFLFFFLLADSLRYYLCLLS